MSRYGSCRRSVLIILPLLPLLGVAPAPSPAAPTSDADSVALKAATALYDGIRVETLRQRPARLPQARPRRRRRHDDGRLQGRLRRRGPRPHRPVALPRTPDVQGHRQDQARRHRPPHAAQRRRQQRLHRTTTTRSSTSTSPPTAGRSPWRSRPTACGTCASTTKHEFEQEKGAVISELKRNEDEPWDLEHKTILPLLFGKKTPYGHPVIGETEHVRAATAEIIKAHYDKWYHPNNASLVVVGGFDPDKALAEDQEAVRPDPEGRAAGRARRSAEVKRDKPVRLEMPSKFEVPRMLMGFNTVTHRRPRLRRPCPCWRASSAAARRAGSTRSWSRARSWPAHRATPTNTRPLSRLVRRPGRAAQGQGPRQGRESWCSPS